MPFAMPIHHGDKWVHTSFQLLQVRSIIDQFANWKRETDGASPQRIAKVSGTPCGAIIRQDGKTGNRTVVFVEDTIDDPYAAICLASSTSKRTP